MIQVGIPWLPEKRLGEACNTFMATVDDWGVILDWDVFLGTNIHWYDLCAQAIKTVGDRAGLISCVTNRIGSPLQKCQGAPQSDDIGEHIDWAAQWEKHCREAGTELIDVTDEQAKLSGFFFLTRREVWDRVGGMPPGKFIGADNWYQDRVKELGYSVYVMRHYYVYHSYKRLWKNAT